MRWFGIYQITISQRVSQLFCLMSLKIRPLKLLTHFRGGNKLTPRDNKNTNYLYIGGSTPQSTEHDDVIKWKHFPRYWPFVRGIPRSPVNSPYKGQWRGSLMFSLICVCINGSVNNREAGELETLSRPLWRHFNDTVAMPADWDKFVISNTIRQFEVNRLRPQQCSPRLLLSHFYIAVVYTFCD